MFAWLRRMIDLAPPRPTAGVLLETVRAELASTAAWDGVRARRWLATLEALCAGHMSVFSEHLPELRELIARWYAGHPFEIVWSRDYSFQVRDPLGITTDDAIGGEQAPLLRPWATLLRTFMVGVGGPNLFHHGIDLEAVLLLLQDDSLPRRTHKFVLPTMDRSARYGIDELVAVLCDAPGFAELEHLVIRTAVRLEPRHLERLAAAPWAAKLRSLDLTETMVDWSVDVEDEWRHAALRALRRFTGLTHLVLYNDIHLTPDLAVLLEEPLVNLTHLTLGHGPQDADMLDLLATTRSLPKLQELCFGGGPVRTDPAWDRVLGASFPIYLHGMQVSAEYPKRC
jgi:hypothetical protein